jgi:hypothetical protein
MNGRRLGAGDLNDVEQLAVPGDDECGALETATGSRVSCVAIAAGGIRQHDPCRADGQHGTDE